MTKPEVIERFCKLSTRVARERYEHMHAADCFCGQFEQQRSMLVAMLGTALHYEFDEAVMTFIETAVTAALARKEQLA